MATLPDGSSVSIQQTEQWDYDASPTPPLVISEGWNLIPPEAGFITVGPERPKTPPGTKETVSGNVSLASTGGADADVDISVIGPSNVDSVSVKTDSNGDYSAEIGPFETAGEYQITAVGPGLDR